MDWGQNHKDSEKVDKEMKQMSLQLLPEVEDKTPSQKAKQIGLKSLGVVIELTGQSAQTISNWAKNKPELFEVVLTGCAAKLKENDSAQLPQLPQIGNGDYRLFDGEPLPFRLTFSKHEEGAVEDIGVLFEENGELKFRGGTDECAKIFFEKVIKKYKDTYG